MTITPPITVKKWVSLYFDKTLPRFLASSISPGSLKATASFLMGGGGGGELNTLSSVTTRVTHVTSTHSFKCGKLKKTAIKHVNDSRKTAKIKRPAFDWLGADLVIRSSCMFLSPRLPSASGCNTFLDLHPTSPFIISQQRQAVR